MTFKVRSDTKCPNYPHFKDTLNYVVEAKLFKRVLLIKHNNDIKICHNLYEVELNLLKFNFGTNYVTLVI